jgi:glucose-1-phosphate thymidylyltransferase
MRDGGGWAAELGGSQRAMAERGIKGMIPFGAGRPFLDYALSGLADAGVRQICLVIGPAHPEIRSYYEGAGRPSRLQLQFAIQARPLGTADALLAAEPFAAGESVLMVNADNLYPTTGLRALLRLPRAGLLGFRRSALLGEGNIHPERIAGFALLEMDPDGELTRIVEKPTLSEVGTFAADPLVSMNAWLLPPTIYSACRAIGPSPRGELELVDAVRHSMEQLGERFQVIESREGVLDLSSPRDIPEVAARLQRSEARP